MYKITIEATELSDLATRLSELAADFNSLYGGGVEAVKGETSPPPPTLAPVPAPDSSGNVPPPPPSLHTAPLQSAPALPGTSPAPATKILDGEGLPHDPRIHAKTPKLNESSGKWRSKRGVDTATVATVTTELRATYPAPAPGTPAPLYDANRDDPAPPPPPEVPTVPAPEASSSIVVTVMDCLSVMMNSAGSEPRVKAMGGEVNTLMVKLGLPDGALSLHANPDKIPAAIAGLQHICGRYEITHLVTFPEVSA